MTWLSEQADGDDPLGRVFGLSPVVYEQYRELVDHVWQPGLISPVLLELCRLRMAQLIGCDFELAHRTPQAAAAGLSDEKVAALRQWPTSPLFDAGERACLSFAESYVIDAHSVTDEQCAELQRHLTPSEVAVLTTALAVFDATARFEVALGVRDPSERS
jgi:alkylhydroperoxidase family enzyme